MNQIVLKNSSVIFSQPKNFINKPEETVKQLVLYLLKNEIYFSSARLPKANVDFNGFSELLLWLDKNGIIFYEKETFFKKRNEIFEQWFWSCDTYYKKLLVLEKFSEQVFDIQETYMTRNVYDSYAKGTIFEWALAFGGKMLLIPKKQKHYGIELTGLLSYTTALAHALRELESIGLGIHITREEAVSSIGKEYSFSQLENSSAFFFLNEHGNGNGVFESLSYKDHTMDYINNFFKQPRSDVISSIDDDFDEKIIDNLISEIKVAKEEIQSQGGIESIKTAIKISNNEEKLEQMLSKITIENEDIIIKEKKQKPEINVKKDELFQSFKNEMQNLKSLQENLENKFEVVASKPTVQDLISLKNAHENSMKSFKNITENIEKIKEIDASFIEAEDELDDSSLIDKDKMSYIFNTIQGVIQTMFDRSENNNFGDKIKIFANDALKNLTGFDFTSILNVSIPKLVGNEKPKELVEKNKTFSILSEKISEGLKRIANVYRDLSEYDKIFDDDDVEINKAQLLLNSIQNRLTTYYNSTLKAQITSEKIINREIRVPIIKSNEKVTKKTIEDNLLVTYDDYGIKFENSQSISLSLSSDIIISENEFVYALVLMFLKVDMYLILEDYIHKIIHTGERKKISEWVNEFNKTFKCWIYTRKDYKDALEKKLFNRTAHVFITNSMFCLASGYFENLSFELFMNPLKMFGRDIEIQKRILPYLVSILTDWQYIVIKPETKDPNYGFFEKTLASRIDIDTALSTFTMDVNIINAVQLLASEVNEYDKKNQITLNLDDIEETLMHYVTIFGIDISLFPERYMNAKDVLFYSIFKSTAKLRAEKMSFFTNDKNICEKDGNPYISVERTNEVNPNSEFFSKKKFVCKFSPDNPIAANLLSGWGFDVQLVLFDLKWFPCRGTVCDVLNQGYIPVLENSIGPDDSCAWGTRFLGCRPLFVSDKLSALIAEMKLKCANYNIMIAENKEKFKSLCIEAGQVLVKAAAALL